MPLLFNAFIASPAGQRNHVGRCISAYAMLTEPALLETYFKTVVKKLIKVSEILQHITVDNDLTIQHSSI